uniref:Cruzioseptin-15 n=1 Tax=Cruziohyla calcarifer TaxID=318249 RepID=CZS15_CRUCA|nr:RecName: Full=Cruzioseptin-15; Short=CZS-15 [Cruziohyla calcarifer]
GFLDIVKGVGLVALGAVSKS